MFELDRELAQDIVTRAMAILPYNVNVMDSQGLILASGEPSRIDTRHEGAQLVLSNARVVAIDSQAAACLKGVQPGINLPLFFDRRLIGVLGITGEPEQVRLYGELLRMTAEMLVAQRHQQAERQWRRQRSDDLMALLLEEGGDAPRLLDEARLLGLKPQLMRTPWLFELAGGQSAERLGDWLQGRYPDSWCVSPAAGSLLWCQPGASLDEPAQAQLLERVEAQGWQVLRVAVGELAEGVEGMRHGYRRVRDLLAYGRAILPRQRLLGLARYRLPTLLWHYRDDEAVRELLRPLQRLRARDAGGQLLGTLRCWCEHRGHGQACADALGVHRNSLRYRLERIAELSGVDPLRLDGLLTLYLGLQLLPEA
ncbi:carbohydrate diacid transcriptional regulator [Azotobacter vinelandii CA]|uniref:Carbohydrate diacid transcriptional regulator n=2 Tax=Azotobacter vinelandii TaxID=354 RepID=C1DFR3_AZOVD|nr:sugar diacid recognition domain-containing protein [Azotobacter vinelandii]ACO80459.1 carbohydrate diacid transcriptional regulator [Azotobacter vinelandii DJ]AGK13321.1 carbohydrate diacid transcriptional regulator [Azotobacter vinelandii CA]AGK17652.1 carbohydrate diacid transcriptional regulator [Azotobacter vinelandii CA6]WKN21217.1 helix-turn-helix domain-containing protein [Azotobacter vinelandii]SFX70553.1 transcriptional regulator, CdaR family [Azotobacter vinelandii]